MTPELCYELRLSGTTQDEDVVSHLDALRVHAEGLEVAEITPLWRVSQGEFLVDLSAWGHRPLPSGRHFIVRDVHGADPQRTVPNHRLDVAGFCVRPDARSKGAVFGLIRPEGPEVRVKAPDKGERNDWFWGYYIESPLSDAVARILTRARELGFDVAVREC
jgi:hypothetical protein